MVNTEIESTLQQIINQAKLTTKHSPDVHWIFNSDFTEIYYISPAFESIWQTDKSSLIKNPANWMSSLHNDCRLSNHPALNDPCLSKTQAPQSYEYILNNERPIKETAWPIVNENNDFIAYYAISSDITDSKFLSKQSSSNQSTSELFAIVAHELKTPLNTMLGLSQLLLNTGLSAEQQREYLQTITQSARQQQALISDLIQCAVLKKQTFELENHWFTPYSLIEGLVLQFQPQALAKRIKVVRINNCAPNLHVLGDSKRLYQVLSNIIANAIKFTDKGKIEISLDHLPCADTDTTEITCKIKDSGCGILEDNLRNIFCEYFQADHAPEQEQHDYYVKKVSGIGMGLYIAKSIIEKMHGQLSVSSKPGYGSEFTCKVKLPLKKEYTISTEPPKKMLRKVKARILIVEDNKINQKVLCDYLESQGNKVWKVDSGLKALDQLQKRKFDFILIDLSLPDMNGFDVAKQYIKKNPDSPSLLVAVSAHSSPIDLERAKEAGMHHFIEKPIDFKMLDELFLQWMKEKKKTGEKV